MIVRNLHLAAKDGFQERMDLAVSIGPVNRDKVAANRQQQRGRRQRYRPGQPPAMWLGGGLPRLPGDLGLRCAHAYTDAKFRARGVLSGKGSGGPVEKGAGVGMGTL